MQEAVDWASWVVRFDKMQDRYLMRRQERFALIVAIIQATRPAPSRVFDLGCGTGSLTQAILEAFSDCQVVGIDLDTTLLPLARARLTRFGERVQLVCADLRDGSWLGGLTKPFDAAVSATALHWMSPANLARLYGRLAGSLAPGAVFLNADHVASELPAVQKHWEQHRAAERQATIPDGADSWDGFFQAYGQAIGVDPAGTGENSVGPWEGVEDGMPLAWHFDRLREAGLAGPECFWRCDCDAIYGAFKPCPSRKSHPPA